MATCNPFLILSQNERDAILKNEKKKWEKFRLQQVRAQSRNEAERIRKSAKEVEKQQRLKITNQVKKNWEIEQKNQIQELENKCLKGFQEFGEAHRSAKVEINALQAFKDRRAHDSKVAAERGRMAMGALDREKALINEKENVNRLQKSQVLQQERKRAGRIAKLPTPQKFKAQRKLVPKVTKKVMFHEAGTFTTSSYVPTRFKIVKEKDIDHISAKESAEKENENYEKMEELKMKKEEENNRKIDDRGKQARKREKTKEMYSQLMKELEEAENDHRLSDFLQGDDDVEGVKAELLSKNLGEKIAESKVRDLLRRENVPEDTEPKEYNKMVSKIENISRLSGEKEMNLDVRDHDTNEGDLGAEDETDKRHIATKPLPTFRKESSLRASKDIHLKETVPVHEVPIVKEKFLVRVPEDDSLTSTQKDTTSDDFYEKSKSDTSSFEELKVKITVNPPSSVSSSVESPGSSPKENTTSKETLISEYTDYFQLSRDSKSKPTHKKIPVKKTILSSSSSTVPTEYYDIPQSLSADSNFTTIKKNIQAVHETGDRVRKLIEELKKQRSDSSEEKPEKDLSAFKTPPRIYTETLKSDSASKKPVPKREKYEKCKKQILEYYVPLMIRMKEAELRQITGSTVGDSGISLSSESNISDLIKYINVPRKDSSSVSSIPTISSDMLSKFSDVDIIPSKLSSSTPISSSITSSHVSSTTAATSTITSPSLHESSEAGQIDANTKEQCYIRLLELQRLKQKILLLQQCAANQLDSERGQSQIYSSGSKSKSFSDQQIGIESTIDWSSCNNYQTPTREISTQSWSSFSQSRTKEECVDGLPRISLPRILNRKLIEKRDLSESALLDEMKPVKMMESSSSSSGSRNVRHASRSSSGFSTNSSYSAESDRSSVGSITQVPLQQELKIVNDSIRRLASALENDNPSSAVSSPSGEENTPIPSTSSSTGPSIPDMTQILERFGLRWASSMIKKMDRAEENNSSDDGVNK